MVAFESLSQTIHKKKKTFLLILFIFSYFLRTSTLLSALRCPQSSPFTKPETTPPLRVKILTFYCKYSFLSLEAYALSGICLHKMVMFKSVTLDAV